jgi:hypothetical protein
MGFLFGGQQQKPAAQAVTRMPVQSELDRSAAAQQRRLAANRTGRSSTMLSRRTGEAGTVAYGNSLLGQAG